jgi:hypothetical protein
MRVQKNGRSGRGRIAKDGRVYFGAVIDSSQESGRLDTYSMPDFSIFHACNPMPCVFNVPVKGQARQAVLTGTVFPSVLSRASQQEEMRTDAYA